MVNQQKPTKPKETAEETKFRKNLFPDVKEIKNKNVLCTSCGRSVKDLVAKGKPISHPFMETLLCEKCSKFYGDGQFSEDEDGCDKYCRWCGQGGTLFLCSNCTAGFCKKCVKRNLPRSALQEIENDDWVCYCCNATPLFELRAQCWAANLYAAEHSKADKSSSSSKSSSKKKRGRDESTSEDEDKSRSKKMKTEEKKKDKKDKDESKSSKEKSKHKTKDESKSKNKDKSENGDEPARRKSLRDRKSTSTKEEKDDEEINGVKKAQWNVVVKHCKNVTSDIATITKNMHKKLLEFRAKKVDLNQINSFESLAEVRQQVNFFLTTLSEKSLEVKETFDKFCEDWIKETKSSVEAKEEANLVEPEKNSIENGIVDSSNQKDTDIDKDESRSYSAPGSPAKPTSECSPKPTEREASPTSDESKSKAAPESDDKATSNDVCLPKKTDNESEDNVNTDLKSTDGEKMEIDSIDASNDENIIMEPNENVNNPIKNNDEDKINEIDKTQIPSQTEESKLSESSEKDKKDTESSQLIESVHKTPDEENTTPPKESPSPTLDKADSSQS